MAEKEEIVLVVDDEESVRTLLQRILQGAGYQTLTAASGKEALNMFFWMDSLRIQEIPLYWMDGFCVFR